MASPLPPAPGDSCFVIDGLEAPCSRGMVAWWIGGLEAWRCAFTTCLSRSRNWYAFLRRVCAHPRDDVCFYNVFCTSEGRDSNGLNYPVIPGGSPLKPFTRLRRFGESGGWKWRMSWGFWPSEAPSIVFYEVWRFLGALDSDDLTDRVGPL